MQSAGGMERFGHVVDAVYGAALQPAAWPAALAALCGLFNCHFGDAFARTTDFQTYRGIAHGLDADDYQHGLLDTWVKRNVWSAVHPVREAGVVVTTRDMVAPETLKRSEMFGQYLDARSLHEGLRFDLWAADGWVQDVSLIRSWSAGPFGPEELRLARMVLPHLQRAVAVARRLDAARATEAAGFAAMEALRQPVFLTDGAARVLRANAAGERLLRSAGPLVTENRVLAGRSARATERLRATVARAAGPGGVRGADLSLPGADASALSISAVPAPMKEGWASMPNAVLVLAGSPSSKPAASPEHLARLFDLTQTEAEVAQRIMAGRSVGEIARDTGRSVNTVRTHVARLMVKTGTHRQAALVATLLQAPPERPEAGGPRFG